MAEVEVENLNELIADYHQLRYDRGLAWDLDEKLGAVQKVVEGLGERSESDSGSDLQRVRSRLKRAERFYWLTFTLFLIGIVLAIGTMVTEFIRGGQAFSFWWFGVPMLFLIPVGVFGERKRRLESAEMFFEEYPRLRQLAVRQVALAGIAPVDIDKLWDTPKERQRALVNLQVFHRFKNPAKTDMASAHGVQKVLLATGSSIVPLLFRSPDEVLWKILIMVGFLTAFGIAYWAMSVANTVRELLAQTGPSTLTQLVQMEQEFPGLAADSESENQVVSHEATAVAFRREMEWLAKLARRAGRKREPDYRMCLALERPSLRWSIVSILLLLMAFQRIGSATTVDWIVLPVLIAWMSFHLVRSTRLHGIRMQFEKFGRQNLSEVVLLDPEGKRVNWARSGKLTWGSIPGMGLFQELRRSSQARSQS